jgi:hypothetical protein
VVVKFDAGLGLDIALLPGGRPGQIIVVAKNLKITLDRSTTSEGGATWVIVSRERR